MDQWALARQRPDLSITIYGQVWSRKRRERFRRKRSWGRSFVFLRHSVPKNKPVQFDLLLCKRKCVTKTLLLLSWTTVPACAKPALLATTRHAPSFRRSSDDRATRESWSAWDRRTPTSATKRRASAVSSRSNTPSNTASWRTGTTWKR